MTHVKSATWAGTPTLFFWGSHCSHLATLASQFVYRVKAHRFTSCTLYLAHAQTHNNIIERQKKEIYFIPKGGIRMINSIFETIGQSIQGFMGNLTSVFSSITSLFWTPGTGSEGGQLTLLGIVLLITAGVSLTVFAFRFIASHLRRA